MYSHKYHKSTAIVFIVVLVTLSEKRDVMMVAYIGFGRTETEVSTEVSEEFQQMIGPNLTADIRHWSLEFVKKNRSIELSPEC